MLNVLAAIQRRTPLGWLQLSHEKGRLLVAIAGVAFADILMLMQLGFQDALFQSAVRLHETMNADIVVLNPQTRNLMNAATFPRRRLFQALDVPGVQSADALYTSMVIWRHPITRKESSMLMLGFNPSRQLFDRPDMNQQLNRLTMPNVLLFDQKTRGDYKEAIAQFQKTQKLSTEIEHHELTIRGLIEVGSSFGADGSLIASDQTYLRLFPRKAANSLNFGLIRLKPGADLEQTQAQLKQHLPNDVIVLTKAEFLAFEQNYWSSNTPIGFIFRLGVIMGFTVGVIIVYQVLSTDVNAHMGEYATFKAMGYDNRYLLIIIFEEAIILAILGFIPGIAVSAGLYQLTRNATNLPIAMSIARGIAVLILTGVMCVLSGAIATRKLQSADPADIF
jgi:putative ABC transport system permease protein